MQVTEQFETARLWVATAVAGVAAFVVGSVVAPTQVYWGFVWRYFWGPVYADANNAACAVARDGASTLAYRSSVCERALEGGAFVAEPGYTLVSEAGYMILLLFALVGVFELVKRLEIAADRDLFYALVPFMLFGGALRVVEDANDAVPSGVEPAISYPLNVFIISPIIYVTVFVVTLGALLATIGLRRRGYVDSYARPMGAVGSAAFVLTFGYLLYRAFTTEYVAFHPQVLTSVVVIATVLAVGIYAAVDRWKPAINAGTGAMGLVVLWGHAIDGVANVIAADWLGALGVNLTYGAKHPANRIIIGLTESVVPQSVLAVLGSSWPFLLVKLVVALGVVWLFDERIVEESPRYAILLLTAIVAVGLGPGTRDVIRATFGI